MKTETIIPAEPGRYFCYYTEATKTFLYEIEKYSQKYGGGA